MEFFQIPQPVYRWTPPNFKSHSWEVFSEYDVIEHFSEYTVIKEEGGGVYSQMLDLGRGVQKRHETRQKTEEEKTGDIEKYRAHSPPPLTSAGCNHMAAT